MIHSLKEVFIMIKDFEAESYLMLLVKINTYATENDLQIIDFSTKGNTALVFFKEKEKKNTKEK